jgi:hypothetical protein
MSSCAGSSTASSTWTTSRPMCCRPTTATWAGSPTWVLRAAAPFFRAGHATANWWRRSLTPAGLAPAQECKGCSGKRKWQSLRARLRSAAGTSARALRERAWRWCVHPRVLALRDDARVRLIAPGAAHRPVAARGRSAKTPRCAGRLDRAAAAPRKLPGPAAGAPRPCMSACCAAGRGPLAGTLPAAAPWRDRRAGQRRHAGRTVQRRRFRA